MDERQAQRPMTESMYTPKPTPLLDPTHQASCLITSDSPILSPPDADHREHGTASLALSSADHYDGEDGDGAYVQGAVQKQSQARRSIIPPQETQLEQDHRGESNRRVISRQGSGSEVRETLEDEYSYNEASIIRPSKSQRRRHTIWTPAMTRKPSNTSPRPLDYNTVPARASQRVKLSQPQSKPVPGRRKTNERSRTCFLGSDTPGTTADHGTDIDYDHSDNDDNDDDCDEENEHEDEFTGRYNQRIRKLWLESEEALLLSLKDKQGMDWEEVCERFPGRSLGAIKLRYYTLRKRPS
ncbi:unnamed protein product [Alternaria sp. RS040]